MGNDATETGATNATYSTNGDTVMTYRSSGALRPAAPIPAEVAPDDRKHRSTLIETAIAALPGPYALWAFLLAAVFGVPGFMIARYFDTGSVDRALSLFEPNIPSVGTYFLATFGITLYALLGIRFMRSRTLATQKALVPLVPNGAEVVERTFEPATWFVPPAILTPVLLLVSFGAFPDQIQDVTGPGYFTLRILSFPLSYFIYATFIWVYLSSIRSLHLLGKGPLQLASFLEDSHFGLKPVGSLSLFLALVYFIGLVLVAFSFLSLPLLFVGLIAALAFPGIVLFFLPLFALHGRMLDEGAKAHATLAAAYSRAAPLLNPGTTVVGPAAGGAVPGLLALQILEHRVSNISRWPLDLRTVSWFSAILLSVAAAIATRYVLSYLGG